MEMQRYDAYYKNDFNDKLSAMLERSEDGDLVLYADALERERVLREALEAFRKSHTPNCKVFYKCHLCQQADAALAQ